MLTPDQIANSFAAGPEPERLTATLGPGADQVTISWPATLLTEGYALQVSSSLSSPNWQGAGTPTVVNGMNQVTLTRGGVAAFFRLSR